MKKVIQLVGFLGVFIACNVSGKTIIETLDISYQAEGFVVENGSWVKQHLEEITSQPLKTWGTLGDYTDSTDETGHYTGTIISELFEAPASLTLFLSGYWMEGGISILLRNTQGDELPLAVHKVPDPIGLYQWKLPVEWQGEMIQIIARDNQPARTSWITLSQPLVTIPEAFRYSNFRTALIATFSAILPIIAFFLIGFAGYRIISRRWNQASEYKIILYFIGPCLIAHAVFFVYLWSNYWGFLLSIGILGYAFFTATVHTNALIKDLKLVRPGSVIVLIAAFLLTSFSNHLIWNPENSIQVAQERYVLETLPLDNYLPYHTMDKLLHGDSLKPYILEWKVTDRTQLQAALNLLLSPLYFNQIEAYQGFSTFLQIACLIGVFSFCNAVGLSQRQQYFIAGLILLSTAFLYNAAFVWPRLFPVLFLFWMVQLLFFKKSAASLGHWLIIGFCSAICLLLHPGNIIALVGIFVVYLFTTRIELRNPIIAATIVVIFTLLPWFVFQKSYDPPGNALAKINIAGYLTMDDVSLSEAFQSSLSTTSLRQWLTGRWDNFKSLTGDYTLAYSRFWDQLGAGSYLLRGCMHTFLCVSMGVVLLAFALIPLLLKTGSSTEKSTFIKLLTTCLIGLLIWILIMFVPGSAAIFRGTYYFPLMLTLLAGYLLSRVKYGLPFIFVINTLFISAVILLPRMRSVFHDGHWMDVEIMDYGSAMIVLLMILAITAIPFLTIKHPESR